jgi:hypothetical protein
MTKRANSRCWRAAIVLAAGLAAGGATGGDEIGRVLFEVAGLPGVVDPEEHPVRASEVLLVPAPAGFVHLANGSVLRLEENSAAVFEPRESGHVAVRLLAGHMAMLDGDGQVLRAGAGSQFTVGPSSAPALDAERALVDLTPPRHAVAERIARERTARASGRTD